MSEAVWTEEEPAAEGPEGERAALARAEAYLGRVSRLNGRIDRKLRLRDRLLDLSVPVPGAAPGADSAVRAARLAALEKEIDTDVDHLVNLKDEVWRVLDRIGNPEAALILDDCYLQGLRPVQAIRRSGYSSAQFYRLRRWGLLEVDRLLREDPPMSAYVSPLN